MRTQWHQTTMAVLIGLLALTGSSAQAALITPLITSNTATNNNHTGVLGGTFTATSTGIVIDRLGFFDADGLGLAVAHDVGLYEWNGSAYILQTKANVPAGTLATLEGGYRWVATTPFTLTSTSSQQYLVYASTTSGDGDSWGSATSFNATIGGLAVQSWYGSGGIGSLGSSASLDGSGGAGFQYSAGNIGFAVPEPSSLAMLAFGSVFLWFVKGRRTK